MNFIRKISLFLMVIMFSACGGNPSKTDKNSKLKSDNDSLAHVESSSNTSQPNEKTPEEIEARKNQEIVDSITTIRTLELALQIANKHKSERTFSLKSDSLDIEFGYLFSKTAKHLIVKRKFEWSIYIDIYKIKNQQFKLVCSKDLGTFTFLGDTVQDVNGDGRLDFLLNWYPQSGCCPRDVFIVFLQGSNGDFSQDFEFLNPVFSPSEKLIRGRCYGYEAPLYKYKWRGFNVDTIEYIYFPGPENGPDYVRRKRKDRNEKGQILKNLPDEYKKIGFDKY